jgi:acyl carrier protein
MEIMATVRNYLQEDLAVDRPEASLGPAEDLVAQGLVDSVGIVKLIAFLESTFAIEIEDEDVLPENLGSLERIERFVLAKKNGKPRGGA